MLFDPMEELCMPVKPRPYTFDETLEMLGRGNSTILDVIEEGKMLYAEEVFNELLAKYHEVNRAGKLKRTRTSTTF